jgi:hypothetical protein
MNSKVDNSLNHDIEMASRREVLLYWAGFLVVVLGSISILMTISDLLVEVLSYRSWYPIVLPLFGISQPPTPTQVVNMPFYCVNPAVVVVRFVFDLLSGLIIVGAGFYMMLNGKKH